MDSQIVESNKLIAEFMGYAIIQDDIYNIPSINGIGYTPKFMMYHSSWGWLHPVIAKIHNIELPLIANKWQDMTVNNDTLTQALYNDDIKSAYDVVVEFLKWHHSHELNK